MPRLVGTLPRSVRQPTVGTLPRSVRHPRGVYHETIAHNGARRRILRGGRRRGHIDGYAGRRMGQCRDMGRGRRPRRHVRRCHRGAQGDPHAGHLDCGGVRDAHRRREAGSLGPSNRRARRDASHRHRLYGRRPLPYGCRRRLAFRVFVDDRRRTGLGLPSHARRGRRPVALRDGRDGRLCGHRRDEQPGVLRQGRRAC